MFKVGIIGCGGISPHHHKNFTATGRAEVVLTYDILPEVAREKALAWKAQVAASAEELIDNVDIVVIATPGFAHREDVEQAAAAGRHIYC